MTLSLAASGHTRGAGELINVRKLYLVGLTLALAGCQQHTAGPQPTAVQRVTPTIDTSALVAAAKRREERASAAMQKCFQNGMVEFMNVLDVYGTASLAYDSCRSEVREWVVAMSREIDVRWGITTPHETIEQRITDFRSETVSGLAVKLRRTLNQVLKEREKPPAPEAPRRKPTEQSI